MKFFHLLFVVFATFFAKAQLCVPQVFKYNIQDYQAGIENWSVVSDTNHIMYFANSEGILEFDGSHWRLIKTQSGYSVRSLCVNKNNKIYVGADQDIGYLETDENGRKYFISLLDVCPLEYRLQLKQVWKVCSTPDYIYFLTNNFILVLNQKNQFVKVINTSIYLRSMFLIDNELYAYSNKLGLLKLEKNNQKFVNICNNPLILNQSIEYIDSHPLGGLRLHLYGKGFYQFNKNKLKLEQSSNQTYLGKEYLFSFCSSDKYLYCGTTTNGFCVLDKNNLDYNGIINKSIGLSDDKIFALYIDLFQNLWVCHENGISRVELNSSVTYINDYMGISGQGFCSKIYKDKYFWGTSHGLFVTDPKLDFKYKPTAYCFNDLRQPVYFLQNCETDLLIGCHLGLYKYNGNSLVSILTDKLCFCIKEIPEKPNQFLIGTNTGIYFYNCQKDDCVIKKIKGCNLDIKQIEFQNDEVFYVVDQSNRLVKFKIQNNSEFQVIELGEFSSLRFNKLVKFQNSILVATNKGIFKIEYDPINKFERFKQIGDSNSVSVLANMNNKQLWAEKSYYNKGKQQYKIQVLGANFKWNNSLLNLNSTIGENKYFNFEYVNNDLKVLGGTNGFVVYNSSIKESNLSKIHTLIRKITLSTTKQEVKLDGVVFGNSKVSLPIVNNEQVLLTLKASFPYYNNTIQYAYKIEGIDTKWSDWSTEPEFERSLTQSGKFVCKVRSRLENDTSSFSESSFEIELVKPWYQTYWWYGLELLGMALIVGISSYFNKNGNTKVSKISAFVIVLIILTIFETSAEIIQDWLNASGVTVFALKIAINIIIALSINPIEHWLKSKLISKPII